MKKPPKFYLFISLTIILTLILIFTISESFSYLSLSHKERLQSPQELISKNTNSYFNQLDKFDCNYIETILVHPVLGFIHRKTNFRNSDCKISVNNIGLQSNEDLPLFKNEETYNVMILGGSVANELYNYKGNNSRPHIENILNENYLPPGGRKRFQVHLGSMGQWAMPNQTNMIQMYSDRIDAAISIDGYNESLNVFNGRRHEAINLPTMLMSVKNYDDPIFYIISLYKNSRYYILNSRLKNYYTTVIFYRFLTARLQSFIFSQKTEDEFANLELSSLPLEKAQKWSLDSLERYNKNLHYLAHSNNIEIAQFFQPNRFMGKTLTDTEKSYNDYTDLQTMTKVSLMYDKLSASKFSVSNLKDLFKNEYGEIYSDHIHFIYDRQTNYSRGYHLMAEKISSDLQKFWKLKAKQ